MKLFPNPRMVFRKEEDGAFLFDPDTGNLNCLNQTGAVIWEICKRGVTEEEIILRLDEIFEIPSKDILLKDVKSFLREMKKAGLIIER